MVLFITIIRTALGLLMSISSIYGLFYDAFLKRRKPMAFKKLVFLIIPLIFVSQAQAELPANDKLKALKASAEAAMSNYKQIHLKEGKCLEVKREEVKANGGHVQIGDCGIGTNQKWMQEEIKIKLANGKWMQEGTKIKLANGKCLQVSGDAKKPGTGVEIWDCNDTPVQVWNYVNGQLKTQENTCLQTAPEDMNKSGAVVQIGTCGDGVNQQWVFDDKPSQNKSNTP